VGGYGSGRWGLHSKKTTVEECRELSIGKLYRDGLLAWGRTWAGGLTWSNSLTGEKTASISLELDTTDRGRPWLGLIYTITERGTGAKTDYNYRLALDFTPLYFGGGRWWVVCPLSKSGQPCGRRVSKLYLPPSGRYFGCRHCYDLTYQSCQESDKRVSQLLRTMAAAGGDLDLSGANYVLLVKAWMAQERRLGRFRR